MQIRMRAEEAQQLACREPLEDLLQEGEELLASLSDAGECTRAYA